MRNLTVELKKCKRTGILVVLPLVGLLGALYAFANFIVRKDVLLNLPLPPMDVLLTQLYGMIMVLNMFGIIVATTLTYNIECIIGNIFLPSGTFELLTLVKYTGYCFVSTLPVLAFMLLVSSRCENIWFTLGIGVAGFFSGMAMSLSDIAIFLINPFVLMMKPAVASTASIDMKVLILGFVETIIFFMVGWYLGKIKHYE